MSLRPPIKFRNIVHRDKESGDVLVVIDKLSTQFTAMHKGKLRFYFYKDKGVTYESN
jgi:hypothetical protein